MAAELIDDVEEEYKNRVRKLVHHFEHSGEFGSPCMTCHMVVTYDVGGSCDTFAKLFRAADRIRPENYPSLYDTFHNMRKKARGVTW